MLQRLIETAPDFTVIQATGVESEMELPFAALHQLCAPLLDRLAELPEPQRVAAGTTFGLHVGPAPDRLLLGLAILNLVASASDVGPLLCVIDDAHWLDQGSLQALGFVARRLMVERIALVFATRTRIDEISPFRELLLEGLPDDDAQTLLGSVLSVPVDERVRDRIIAESGGNPLALLEWPQRVARAELSAGYPVPNDESKVNRVEESFRERIAVLPVPTRHFLTVAAAEPTGDSAIVWRAASTLGIAPLDATMAVDAGLIHVGMQVTFRHPLVRSASYRVASLEERRAAHRALADATDRDLDPDRRAWHRALGSSEPDEDHRGGTRAVGRPSPRPRWVGRRSRAPRPRAVADRRPRSPCRPRVGCGAGALTRRRV